MDNGYLLQILTDYDVLLYRPDWKIDMGMRDECLICRSDAAETLAGVRHIAMNLLTNVKNLKVGIKHKRLKAAQSPDYLSLILEGP